MNRYVPNRLFANPPFLGGLASVLDIGATLQKYNTSKEGSADIIAIANDWKAVGNDIRTAVTEYERAYKQQRK